MVAVVNGQIAKHYWPKGDALGKRFHLRSATGLLVQIVGIAKNSKYLWIAEPGGYASKPHAGSHSAISETEVARKDTYSRFE